MMIKLGLVHGLRISRSHLIQDILENLQFVDFFVLRQPGEHSCCQKTAHDAVFRAT